MSLINYCTKNRAALNDFINQVEYLVGEGFCSFSRLCESDQSEVIGLLLKAMDETHVWDCVVESNDQDVLMSSIMQALVMPDAEHKKYVFEVLQKNAISYYEDSLNELFSEKFNEIEWDNCGDIPSFRLSRDHEYINGTDYRR